MTTARTIDVNELASALAASDVDECWNVLTEDYFSWELIPGSRWVPLDRIGREVASLGLDRHTRIIVYCSGVACPNSRDAGAKLVTLGFTNVRVFEGGLEAWRADGRGVVPLPKATAA